jgi:hypothetical protein
MPASVPVTCSYLGGGGAGQVQHQAARTHHRWHRHGRPNLAAPLLHPALLPHNKEVLIYGNEE